MNDNELEVLEFDLEPELVEAVEILARDRGQSMDECITDLFREIAQEHGLWRPGMKYPYATFGRVDLAKLKGS